MKVELRPWNVEDLPALMQLFYETVHTVAAGDYTPAQLDAWAPEQADRAQWLQSFAHKQALVAHEGNTILGFGDMDGTGYLDRLYTHKDYQGQGVASRIAANLEQWAWDQDIPRIRTHASLTAKNFFLKRGYVVVRENQVERHGQILLNYLMEKGRSDNHENNRM